jgi:hypothetical protein
VLAADLQDRDLDVVTDEKRAERGRWKSFLLGETTPDAPRGCTADRRRD